MRFKDRIAMIKIIRYAALLFLIYFFYNEGIFDQIFKQSTSTKTEIAPDPAPVTKTEVAPDPAPVPVIYSSDDINILKEQFLKTKLSVRKEIQQGVKLAGNYNGVIDGLWGPETEKSLVNFGQSNKIPFNSNILLDRIIAIAVSSKTGEIWFNGSGQRKAPFSVEASPNRDFFIKLREADTKIDVLAAYIKAGETFETKAPLGSFELVYASGENWLGEVDLFEKNLSITRADKTFVFEIVGNQIMGRKIKLVSVQNGNLKSVRLNKDSF